MANEKKKTINKMTSPGKQAGAPWPGTTATDQPHNPTAAFCVVCVT